MTRTLNEAERKAASCDGKQRLTKAVADKVSMYSRHSVMPYKCRFCDGWHVGTSTGKQQSRRKDDSEN